VPSLGASNWTETCLSTGGMNTSLMPIGGDLHRLAELESPCGYDFAIAGRDWRKMTPRSPISRRASGYAAMAMPGIRGSAAGTASLCRNRRRTGWCSAGHPTSTSLRNHDQNVMDRQPKRTAFFGTEPRPRPLERHYKAPGAQAPLPDIARRVGIGRGSETATDTQEVVPARPVSLIGQAAAEHCGLVLYGSISTTTTPFSAAL
jgi:hypothetical protein